MKPKQGKLWLQLPSYRNKAQPPKPPRRISPVSAMRQSVNLRYKRLKTEWWNDLCKIGAQTVAPRCAACVARRLSLWRTALPQPHHTRGKIGPLLCDTRFWLPVCFECHRWIHDNPEKSACLQLISLKGWNSMRMPDAFTHAYRIHADALKRGATLATEPPPRAEDYELTEWEAGQIKKHVDAEL